MKEAGNLDYMIEAGAVGSSPLPVPKKRRGRPPSTSKYRREYCDLIRKYMGMGYSKAASAAKMGVTRKTLENWAAAHPEFNEALRLGEGLRSAFLEELLLSSRDKGLVTAAIFALKNANPVEWGERNHSRVELTGADGGPIAMSALGREELLETAKRLALLFTAGAEAARTNQEEE